MRRRHGGTGLIIFLSSCPIHCLLHPPHPNPCLTHCLFCRCLLMLKQVMLAFGISGDSSSSRNVCHQTRKHAGSLNTESPLPDCLLPCTSLPSPSDAFSFFFRAGAEPRHAEGRCGVAKAAKQQAVLPKLRTSAPDSSMQVQQGRPGWDFSFFLDGGEALGWGKMREAQRSPCSPFFFVPLPASQPAMFAGP